MDYENVIDQVTSSMTAAGIEPEETPTQEETQQDTLNMIGLEIQRKGGY